MNQLLQQFRPITLDEMKGIRLMNRIDTKFVTTQPQLVQLLQMALGEYRVQETLGERNMAYRTTYYDTATHDMFRVHQAGHANRQKLRFRTYVSSQLQFMEVKTKNNHGRTKKKRMAVDDMQIVSPERVQFLHEHLRYAPETLQPSLQNQFWRITLVNNAQTERLTIDTELQFRNCASDSAARLPGLVIIELKRDGLCPSPVLAMLRQLRIHPHGFSKYCMGLAFTTPELHLNRMKPKVRDINKLLNITQLPRT